MQKITKQELLALAHLSRLQLTEEEVASLVEQVGSVLHYAHRVKDIAQLKREIELPVQKNRNVLREDVVIKTDSRDIVAQAPESEQNYFVVPVILETT